MKIESVTLQTIRLRLHEPFRISSGQTHERTILLARLDSDGLVGWGECVADVSPHYSSETVDTALLMLEQYLVPAVLGRRFADAREVGARLDAAIRGHAMAKAMLEMAAWDLDARRKNVSLATLLGGTRSEVESGVSIGIQDSPGALLERIERFAAEGYRRVKIKIAPGWDTDIVRAIRSTFPDLPLMVDANSAYRLADADHLAVLDECGLLMIEQPLGMDDLLDHAELQRRLRTPICLDECITSPARCAEAIHLGSGRIVNIKPGRVGGHGPALEVHDRCEAAGLPVWCGGMLESGIGRAHNVALASLPNFTLPGDISASSRYWTRDIVSPAFELTSSGTIRVPTGPGIGVEMDEDFLAAICSDSRVFTVGTVKS